MRNILNIAKRPYSMKLKYQGRAVSTLASETARPDLEHSVINPDAPFKLWEIDNRTSLQFTLSESHGVLNKALNILTTNQINMTRIYSKPSKFVQNNWRKTNFFIDIEGKLEDSNVKNAIAQLKIIADDVTEVGSVEVPWFPT